MKKLFNKFRNRIIMTFIRADKACFYSDWVDRWKKACNHFWVTFDKNTQNVSDEDLYRKLQHYEKRHKKLMYFSVKKIEFMNNPPLWCSIYKYLFLQ